MRYIRPSTALLSVLLFSAPLAAQIGGNGVDGDLVVATSRTLSSDREWNLRTLTVARGAVLRFEGNRPALLRVQGKVEIFGKLSVEPRNPTVVDTGQTPGAGGYKGTVWLGLFQTSRVPCTPLLGSGPGRGGGNLQWSAAGWVVCGFAIAERYLSSTDPSQHRGRYGSDLPCSLTGGSGAADILERVTRYPCAHCFQVEVGGAGGGAVAILSDAAIRVAGTVSALPNNDTIMLQGIWPVQGGTSGSILLRSMDSVTIEKAAVVTAGGARPGYVRIDAYESAPTLVGLVDPQPRVLTLPALVLEQAPQIGKVMKLRCVGLPGDIFAIFYSWKTARIDVPPFGTLRLDPSAGFILAGAVVASTSEVDAIADFVTPVHNDPRLIGWTLHTQAANLVTRARPRLTNLVSTIFTR